MDSSKVRSWRHVLCDEPRIYTENKERYPKHFELRHCFTLIENRLGKS
jgi:hypothetical protein